MPTSGTYLWSPDLAECVDDAFERCRIDPGTLDVKHMISARRSINFMLSDWAADDNQSMRIDRLVIPLVEGTQEYIIDPDTDGRIIDVNQVALTRDNTDTSIYPMSRQEWLDIPNKDIEGRPSRYFADKRQGSVVVSLWTVPENSTDTLLMDCMRRFQDAGLGGQSEPDIPFYMREAFVSGLAWWLGQKFAPEQILERLKGTYDEAFEKANGAQRVRGDLVIVPASNTRLRRGGRIR